MIAGKIRTPKGKRVTAKAYIALAERNQQPCEHGHIGCAAWEHGPCVDEMVSAMEDNAHTYFVDERD